MAKNRVYTRGKIRSLVKPKRPAQPHHWKKAKAIAAYLNRRQGLPIKLVIADLITLSEVVAKAGIGHVDEYISDSVSFSEALVLGTVLNKDEILGLAESLASSVGIGTSNITSITDTTVSSFGKTLTGDTTSLTESLALQFSTSFIDSATLTEGIGIHIAKALSSSFIISETDVTRGVTLVTTDDLTVSHTSGDVAITGTFQDKTIGGEPFNTLTFN